MNTTDSPNLDVASGLDGIPAAATALSHVDGQAGRLILCGEDLADFASRHSFESAAAMFWAAACDEPVAMPDTIRAALGRARVAAFERLGPLTAAFEPLTLSEALRVALASLPAGGAPAAVGTPAATPPPDGAGSPSQAPHLIVTGALPVFVANLARFKAGQDFVPPDPALPQVDDFLRMLGGGAAPNPNDVTALTAYLVTVMDHGMNASTFAARVIASTHADLVSAVVGAYAALTGPLHGGAPEPVLDMLDAIGRPERAAAWIEAALARGERLMGFGHRIYKVRDPRADVLKAALETLNPSDGKLVLARAVEKTALAALERHKPGRKLETNVEFYTAMLLDGLRIPRAAFTPVFAMGRVVGWTAHAFEQRRTGRLIRPDSRYVGRMPPA